MKKIIFPILLILALSLFSLRTNAQEACQGCISNNECIVIGEQVTINNQLNYCSLTKQLTPVKSPGQSCQNNFECSNGFCSYGQCASKYKEVIEQKNLIQQIVDFISGKNIQTPPNNNGGGGGGDGGGSSRKCTPNWQCTEFSLCINNQQSRSCSDSNRCNTNYNKPMLVKNCVMNPTGPYRICNEAWQCTPWSICKDGEQIRDCNDLNICGTISDKPNTIQPCQEQQQKKSPTFLIIAGVIVLILIIFIISRYIKRQYKY